MVGPLTSGDTMNPVLRKRGATPRYFAAALAVIASALAIAQPPYPERPIRIVVPSSAGGGYDITARAVTRSLSVQLGKPFVIDNKPGAAGTLGAAQVAKAPADGYTLMWTGNGPVTLS